MSATAQPYTEMHFPTGLTARIGSALRVAFTGRGAAKRIAQAADADPRTASAWLYGQNAPRSAELIALMAANDELEQQILALVRELRERGSCPTNGNTTLAHGAGNTSPEIPRGTTTAG